MSYRYKNMTNGLRYKIIAIHYPGQILELHGVIEAVKAL